MKKLGKKRSKGADEKSAGDETEPEFEPLKVKHSNEAKKRYLWTLFTKSSTRPIVRWFVLKLFREYNIHLLLLPVSKVAN